MIYHRKRTGIKISHGNRYGMEARRDPQVISSWTALIPPGEGVWPCARWTASQGRSPEPSVSRVLRGLKSHAACTADLQSPVLPRDRIATMWAKASRRSVLLGVPWKDWCWSCNSSTLATSCEELTHWKRPWCWEGLGAGGEGDDRGWNGWTASPTRWAWVWVNAGSWWWTGWPGMLRFMGSQRVRHDWGTELN